jgi:integrase
METYNTEQLNTLFAATPPGWATLAIQILLGTGMRLAELCALSIDDVEDEGEVTFLKIRSGKGAKFRRVPISSERISRIVRWRLEDVLQILIPETFAEVEAGRRKVSSDPRMSATHVVKIFRIAQRLGQMELVKAGSAADRQLVP